MEKKKRKKREKKDKNAVSREPTEIPFYNSNYPAWSADENVTAARPG